MFVFGNLFPLGPNFVNFSIMKRNLSSILSLWWGNVLFLRQNLNRFYPYFAIYLVLGVADSFIFSEGGANPLMELFFAVPLIILFSWNFVAICHHYLDLMNNKDEQVTFYVRMKRSIGEVPQFILTLMIMGVFILIGLSALVLPGLVVLFLLLYSPMLAVVDHKGQVIKRSYQLSKSHPLETFVLLGFFALSLGLSIASMMLPFIFSVGSTVLEAFVTISAWGLALRVVEQNSQSLDD
jgi:hypothetical protein